MSLRTIIQKKFQNLFIAVILNETECVISCKVVKNGAIKKVFSKTFDDLEPSETLDKEIENYLKALQEEYPFVYIAFLLNTLGQGAFEGIESEDFKKHHVGIHDVLSITMKNQWSVYASLIEIQWAKNLFTTTGLDLLYSPFILLNDCVKSHKQKNKPTCYLLNYQNFFVLAIFEAEAFHVGTFFNIPKEDSLHDSLHMMDRWENEMKEEGISELSQLDIIELSNTSSDETNPEQTDDVMDTKDLNLELYGRDILVYQYLKDFLETYYLNPDYHSEFVEEIVIFDGYEISTELLHQIEGDLMMDVEVHQVDVGSNLCDLAIKEVFQ